MSPAERAQLAATVRQIEALEQQADAMRQMAAALKQQVSGLFLGAASDGEAGRDAPPPPMPVQRHIGSSGKVASRADVMPQDSGTQ